MKLKEAIFLFAFFVFIDLIFFYKIFLGLIPLPADLIVGVYYPWLSYKWGYILGIPVHNPLLSDAVALFFPLKTLAVDLVMKGQLPLWNPYMFGGYPLFASIQLGLLFPTMIFYIFFSPPIAWTIQTMTQPLFACLFMYLFLRHLNLNRIPSIFGSISFGFGGFILIWLEWNTQATTSMFLPILILLEDKYLISKKLRWGILLSILLCLQIFAGYLPIISFTLIALIIWYFLRSKQHIKDLKMFYFILLGIALSSILLFPAIELLLLSQRIGESNISDALPLSQSLLHLIVPDFFGNIATLNFWGKDPQASSLYTGVITVIFSLVGIKNWKRLEVKFAMLLLLFSLLISIANPLSIFLYKLGIWGNTSLTMNKTFFLINFSFAILGAYGLSSIHNYPKLTLRSAIWVLSIILGILIGLLISHQVLIKTHTLPSYSQVAIENGLKNISTSLRNIVLPFSVTLTVLAMIFIQNKFKDLHIICHLVFIFILIFELFHFGQKYNTFSSPRLIFPDTPITKYLEKYPNDRFIAEQNTLSSDMWVPYRISSIAGYDGAYPLNVAKLLAVSDEGGADATPMPRWVVLHNLNSKILDETNSRFIVVAKRDIKGNISQNGALYNYFQTPKYKQVFSDKEVVILENKQSFPRVYLTKKVIKASDKETLNLMLNENFSTTSASISDFNWNNPTHESLDYSLNYEKIDNSSILIKTKSNTDAYLVLLDTFYPGWRALIDGKETLIHRTNYNFRGILLPKGIHNVEFIYAPKSFEYGLLFSAASLLIILGLLIRSKFTIHE